MLGVAAPRQLCLSFQMLACLWYSFSFYSGHPAGVCVPLRFFKPPYLVANVTYQTGPPLFYFSFWNPLFCSFSPCFLLHIFLKREVCVSVIYLLAGKTPLLSSNIPSLGKKKKKVVSFIIPFSGRRLCLTDLSQCGLAAVELHVKVSVVKPWWWW